MNGVVQEIKMSSISEYEQMMKEIYDEIDETNEQRLEDYLRLQQENLELKLKVKELTKLLEEK